MKMNRALAVILLFNLVAVILCRTNHFSYKNLVNEIEEKNGQQIKREVIRLNLPTEINYVILNLDKNETEYNNLHGERGKFTYKGPNNETYSITYLPDEINVDPGDQIPTGFRILNSNGVLSPFPLPAPETIIRIIDTNLEPVNATQMETTTTTTSQETTESFEGYLYPVPKPDEVGVKVETKQLLPFIKEEITFVRY